MLLSDALLWGGFGRNGVPLIPGRVQSLTMVGDAGLLKHRQQESVEYQGVVLDADTGEALSSETGLPLPVAEMGDAEVRAELELRDIPATGSGEQRALRLQVTSCTRIPSLSSLLPSITMLSCT